MRHLPVAARLAPPGRPGARGIAAVTPDTAAYDDCFPERALAQWPALHRLPSTVYAFPRTGVRPLRSAYRRLAKRLGLDAVVLVDGGTDILMRGDEAALGTPADDATSLAASAEHRKCISSADADR